MSLELVTVKNFRNLADLSFSPVDGVNIIYGENGSGKTSLLEAIYYLSHGKSFRTIKYKTIIQHHQDTFVIHAKKRIDQLLLPVGISKNQAGDTELKIQGKVSRKIAELAELIPVQLITPESYALFFGGPKERRKFLDFGLFHVEHHFFSLWLSFNKLLKQRNALLKQKPHNYHEQIKYWDKEFVRLSLEINTLRKTYLERFRSVFFDKIAANLTLIVNLEIKYNSGWKDEAELSELLIQSFTRDVKQGFTSFGPHKADLTFSVNDSLVENYFSRGQLKLLIYALKVTQNYIIEAETQKQSILLIDDLSSELSIDTRKDVGQLLAQCNSQIFITAIESESISAVLEPMKRKLEMFHVKHGKLITS
ncbi:DNA replication/repair protein RecF [Pseudoalteromonas tunicata]|uniref:DNA replication and repair protein RecF n=1 Tax=Pseudoalteromonas tunicata D2 TaxID=87626 RepID=A4CDI5_9GAMM|nr:DNA replication/repair protein RecF [Pseudoalteromonas tunicata]ATC92857.1 DNA replication and repair protein RecF [Pseudoalteromonas tunicata]AXT31961.1 DNA replication/repair protein RecF [Pseudoalteromonas tunicata]EAR27027.1 gap repair protein with nucleoside triP hydrolase domain [Pseudoalteromonas tunicata D2]